MKKILLILLHFSFMGIAFGGPGGELIIKFLPSPPPPSGSYFNLSVNSNDYSWHMENNLLVLDNDFITLTANNKTVYSFGSPRTNIGHGDFRISWGLFTFTITTNAGCSRTFQLDLRDENWAEYYEDHDTYIFIDNTNNKFYISDNSAGIGGYYVTINSGSLYRIFSFWGRQPLQSNFKIPVALKNRIENGPSTDFGSLWANNHEVSSGISEDFRYFTTSNNAQHYTLETVYSNERKYSFKWLPNNVDAVINQNYYSANFSFTLPINNSPKDITRNFKTVWPLTIKNLLPEVGGTESFGEVYFKDPTTDNQFHNYPATNEGFVKNEAYENLEVDPGNGNLQRYSIKAVSTIPYNGRNYYWYSGNFNPTTQTDLLITGPTTKTAKFKGSQISSQSDAYNTTSQRKFIKTPDGCLHSVYSSLNRVWYEMSSDNGVTWSLLNDGQPLDDSQGKLPSIDYVQLLTYPAELDCWVTIIVYQESYSSGFKIKAKSFRRIDDGPYIYKNMVVLDTYSNESYANNANPVLAIDNAGIITFVWERKSSPAGLYCRRATINVNTQYNDVLVLYDLYNSKKLGNINYSTSASSINPSITVSKTVYPGPNGSGRHLAWQDYNEIKYATIAVTNQQEGITLGTIETPSYASGYPSNYLPSLSLANGKPVVSWTGYYDGNIWKITGDQENLIRKRALVKVRAANGWPSVCTELGDNVNYVNNNSVTSASEKTVFVWSQGLTPQSKWVRRSGGAYATIYNLSHSGIENQVTTGTDFNNMTAMVFNKQSVPLYFIKSTTNFSADYPGGGINKITLSDSVITYGRSGIVSKQGVEFVFNTGDVFVADSSVQFTFIADTILFSSAEELNSVARTEDFWLEEGVDFFFSNLYYVIRQELADSVLTEQDQVNFKVELVKVQSGDVVGTFDNITYNKNNLEKYASIHYLVNTSGIQAGEYYLRFVTTVAGDAAYNLSNIQRDEFDLNKLNYVNVSFKGEKMPVTYELSQNYPNPFNPTTTIRYQLPNDGIVTLKVYDILGAEVATLVNEEKIAGRYEVSFDASRLASGVYIYRLQANDYIAVKKMVLLR